MRDAWLAALVALLAVVALGAVLAVVAGVVEDDRRPLARAGAR